MLTLTLAKEKAVQLPTLKGANRTLTAKAITCFRTPSRRQLWLASRRWDGRPGGVKFGSKTLVTEPFRYAPALSTTMQQKSPQPSVIQVWLTRATRAARV